MVTKGLYNTQRERFSGDKVRQGNTLGQKRYRSCVLKNGLTDKAIPESEKTSAFYPENPRLHRRLMELYMQTEEHKKAEKEKVKIKMFHSEYSGYFIR